MKKLFTLAAAVLASLSLSWAADVTLFNVDFTDETSEKISTSSSSAVFVAKTYDTYSMSFGVKSSKDIDITNGTGLVFTGNNAANYNCLAIPMTLTKDNKVTVTIALKSSGKVKYVWVSGDLPATPPSLSFSDATAGTTNTLEYTPTEAGNYVLYIGRSGSSSGKEVQSIVITQVAAAPEDPVCPSGLSISGTKAYSEGEKIELTAALEAGNGEITYQWYKGGKEEANKLDGKTAAKLEISNCKGSDAGDYYCVASKATCADASNAEAYAITVKTLEPTGTANISYALSGSTVTGTVTGVNSISGLSSSFTLGTLTIGAAKDGYSGGIKGCDQSTEVNEAIYADLQFTVADGYVFTPSAVSVKANPLSATGALKAVVKVMDATNSVASAELACAKNTDNEAQFADGAFTGKLFEGTVHIRMYFYGAASDKTFYLKSPITVAGTVAVAPTKYNVAFAAGEGGSGEMATLKYVAGAEVVLPACTFTAPSGKEFDAWTSSDVTISENKFTMPTKNVTVTATWKTELVRHTVTYKEGEATLGTEDVVDGESPAEYASYQTKKLATYAWCSDPELNNEVNLASASITADITYYAKVTYKYASSVNIEQLVLDNGTKYDLMGYMGGLNYATNIENSLDTLNDLENKDNRNYAYLGLKVKAAGKLLDFRLADGAMLKVKFGAYKSGSEPQVSINGAAYAAMEITDGVYSHTASGEELVSIKTATADAVVFKQIMIGEELKVVELPAPGAYLVTCAEAENGTVTAAWPNKKYRTPVGETVTLTVTPNDGYKVADVKVNGESLNAVEGVYSFPMPAQDVTVVATFSVVTAIDNTEAEIKAVKRVVNGQLMIEKNGVIYNAQGAIVR